MRASKIDGYYRDQAPHQSYLGRGRVFSAIYTPHGIHMLDGYYCDLIQKMPNKEFADKLRREIKKNPHLHPKIKDNLLFNLKNYRRQITPASQVRWDALEARKPYEGRKVRILCGHNKDMIGTVRWYWPSPMGNRIAVVSNDPKFWGSLHSKERENYYSDREVKVVEENQ